MEVLKDTALLISHLPLLVCDIDKDATPIVETTIIWEEQVEKAFFFAEQRGVLK